MQNPGVISVGQGAAGIDVFVAELEAKARL